MATQGQAKRGLLDGRDWRSPADLDALETGEGVTTTEEEVVRRPDLTRGLDREPDGSAVSGLAELSLPEVRDNAGEVGDKANEGAAQNQGCRTSR